MKVRYLNVVCVDLNCYYWPVNNMFDIPDLCSRYWGHKNHSSTLLCSFTTMSRLTRYNTSYDTHKNEVCESFERSTNCHPGLRDIVVSSTFCFSMSECSITYHPIYFRTIQSTARRLTVMPSGMLFIILCYNCITANLRTWIYRAVYTQQN